MRVLRRITALRLSSVVIFGFALIACSAAGFGKSTVAVGVHGVNYTSETFSYIIKDPDNEGNSAGGELVNSFSSGGLMCCYSLPMKWRPGLKVVIKSTHWLHEKVDGKLPQFKKDFVVDVPPYVDGQPGELWVIRNNDGSVSVVSSDYSPAHPKWPGAVKGWPVPSEDYRAEKRAIERERVERSLAVAKSTLAKVLQDPDGYAKRMWPLWEQWRQKDYLRFASPSDPGLHKYLRQEAESDIANAEEKLKILKKD